MSEAATNLTHPARAGGVSGVSDRVIVDWRGRLAG